MDSVVAATLLDQRQHFLLDRLRGLGNATADTIGDFCDHGQTVMEKSLNDGLLRDIREGLDRVKHAFHRLMIGQYGICENCGQPISDDRLKAVPEATLCIKCCRKSAKRNKARVS